MSWLTELFAGGAGKLVDSVGNALDKVTTTKEEKLQFELELKKAETNFQLEMQKLSVAEKQIYLEDTDSARKMAAQVQTSEHATNITKNTSAYLAIGTTILTFTLFYILIFRPDILKPETKDVVIYILGVLSAIVTQVFSFYFGSSLGSSDKNKIIQGMQMKKQD